MDMKRVSRRRVSVLAVTPPLLLMMGVPTALAVPVATVEEPTPRVSVTVSPALARDGVLWLGKGVQTVPVAVNGAVSTAPRGAVVTLNDRQIGQVQPGGPQTFSGSGQASEPRLVVKAVDPDGNGQARLVPVRRDEVDPTITMTSLPIPTPDGMGGGPVFTAMDANLDALTATVDGIEVANDHTFPGPDQWAMTLPVRAGVMDPIVPQPTTPNMSDRLSVQLKNITQPGHHVVKVVARDRAGNQKVHTHEFTIAETLPGLDATVTPLARDRAIWIGKDATSLPVHVEGTVTDVTQPATVSLDDRPIAQVATSGERFSGDTTVSGERLLPLKIVDAQGNGHLRTIPVHTDTVAPTLNLTSAPMPTPDGLGANPSISTYDAHLDELTVTLDGVEIARDKADPLYQSYARTLKIINGVVQEEPIIMSSPSPKAANLSIALQNVTAVGHHVMVFTAKDLAGNTTTRRHEFTIGQEQQLPAVPGGDVWVSGVPYPGYTLRARTSDFPTGTELSYTWRRDGVTVRQSRYATSYYVSSLDRGHTITLTVTASKAGYRPTDVAADPVTIW